jgi:cytochrome bd-type quinol oxidase subunit 2
LNISEAPLAWVNCSPPDDANDGEDYFYTFTTNRLGASFSMTTNAYWLALNETTGTINGTADDGLYYITIVAEDGNESVSYTFTIRVGVHWDRNTEETEGVIIEISDTNMFAVGIIILVVGAIAAVESQRRKSSPLMFVIGIVMIFVALLTLGIISLV